ncbi:MAG: DUF2281 domain-containing protein [Bacteroidales bacterium]|nr:DUF2281 domain-containing protein [Bacteroidales bacterium]
MELSSFISGFENFPTHIQRQLIEYAEYLMAKYQSEKKAQKNGKKFSFSWENGLKEMKKEYTSVDLQHKINDLR